MGTRKECAERIMGGDENSNFVVIEINVAPENLGFAALGIESSISDNDELDFIKNAIAYANDAINRGEDEDTPARH